MKQQLIVQVVLCACMTTAFCLPRNEPRGMPMDQGPWEQDADHHDRGYGRQPTMMRDQEMYDRHPDGMRDQPMYNNRQPGGFMDQESWRGGIPEPAHMPSRGREPHDMTVRYEEAVLNDNQPPETPKTYLFTWNSDDPHFYDGKGKPLEKPKEMEMKKHTMMMNPWRDPIQEDYWSMPD